MNGPLAFRNPKLWSAPTSRRFTKAAARRGLLLLIALATVAANKAPTGPRTPKDRSAHIFSWIGNKRGDKLFAETMPFGNLKIHL